MYKSLLGINEVIADSAEISNIDLTDTVITGLTTTNVAEGKNLYFTDTRVNNNSNVSSNTTHRGLTNNPHSVSASQVGIDSTDDITEGLTNLYYTDARFDTCFELKTTADLKEGISNLYYTDIRFDSRLLSKTTDDVKEGLTNLYYTTARVNTDFDARLAIKSTTDLSEGISNLYYTTARSNTDFDARLAIKSTTDLSEGTNLYYTTARANTDFDARLAVKSTTDLSEGTNQYYTDTRVSANTDVSANTAYRNVGHLPLVGGTMTGDLDMNDNSIKNLKFGEEFGYHPVMTSNTTPAGYTTSGISSAYITFDHDANTYISFAGYTDGIWTAGGWETITDQTTRAAPWSQIQLPSAKTLAQFVMTTTNGTQQCTGFVLCGSNDGTTWIELIAKIGGSSVNGITYTSSNLTSYPYFRIIYLEKANTGTMRVNRNLLYFHEAPTYKMLAPYGGDSYDLTMPTALPVSTSLLTLNSTGLVETVTDIAMTGDLNMNGYDITSVGNINDTTFSTLVSDTTTNTTHRGLTNNPHSVTASQVGINSTDNITEGLTNLYYTTARANTDFDARLAIKSTTDLSEGLTNLYYTTARVNTDFDARLAIKSTDDVKEGLTNLYYTTARLNTDFDARLAIKTTDDVKEGLTNLYYTTARVNTDFDSRLLSKSTDDLSEGLTNLYYTDTRVNNNSNVSANTTHRGLTNNPHSVSAAQVGINSTDNISEGLTNLYYTEARVSANTNVAANTAKISYPAADSNKVGFISVTQAVNLDTMESNISTNNAKISYPAADSNKVGFISVTQAVNLDTMESNISTNNAKISYPAADSNKVGFISVTQVVDLDTMESNITTNNAKISYPAADSNKVGFISVTQAVDLDTMESNITANNAKISYPVADSNKVGFISVTQAVNLDTMESNITTNNAKISYPVADSNKVGFISVTQAVNLDTMESNITTNNAKVSADGSISTHSDVALVNPQLNDILIYSTISQDWGNGSFSGMFDTAFGGKSTTNLSEGTNQYYTEARVSNNTDVKANTAYKNVGHLPITGGTITTDPLIVNTYIETPTIYTGSHIEDFLLVSTKWQSYLESKAIFIRAPQTEVSYALILPEALPVSGTEYLTVSSTGQLDTAVISTNYLPLTGGTLSGALSMGNNKITSLTNPTATTDACNKYYADLKMSIGGGTFSGNVSMGNNLLTSVINPTNTTDACNKAYADTKLSLTGGTLSGDLFLNNNITMYVVRTATQNEKIVLWDNNSGSTTEFYGFGVNSATLRYNVPTGGYHRFYSANTELANMNSTSGFNTYSGVITANFSTNYCSLSTPTGYPGVIIGDATRRFDQYLQSNYYRMCFSYNNQGVKLTQGATSWVSASDRRYKKDIEEIKDCCAGLAQIKPYKFFYTENEMNT